MWSSKSKPFNELSRWQKLRRAKAQAHKFIEDLNMYSGDERKLILRTMAKDYPEVLDTVSMNPLPMKDIIEVILSPSP